MAEAIDLSHFVREVPAGKEIELALEAPEGRPEPGLVETLVRAVPGVASARLNLERLRLTIRWGADDVQPARLIDILGRAGYRAYPLGAVSPEASEAAHVRWLLSCLAVAGFAAMNIMLLSVSVWSGNVTDITPETRDFFHWLSALIAIPAAAYAGQPFFRSAMAALRARSLNMDVPITLGILLALGMSVVETARHAEHAYFDSAVMLLFFLLCGRTLDLAMRRRTRAVAGNLAALRSDVARRLDGQGGAAMVPTAALRGGDVLRVDLGERFPADGVVMAGRSEVDEALVTGETGRRAVAPGDEVHCGTSNFGGTVDIRVTAAGEDTLLAEVERLMERACGERSRYVRLADRAARIYAPVVHVTALLTLLGWMLAGSSLHDAIIIAIAVLIITCPCALALAVPTVQVVAAGALFRRGVLLNSADAIERFAEVDLVMLDKTGTVTLPEPELANREAVAPNMLEIAGRLARSSHHPLARVIASQLGGEPVEVAVEEPGRGVRAEIDGREARLGSLEFCGLDGSVEKAGAAGESRVALRHGAEVAFLSIRQALRPDAATTVRRLAAAGYEVRLLSGDRAEAVAEAARLAGIDAWKAEQRPGDKIAVLEEAARAGRRVLMVGDGLNDAPALAAAHASLAPATAADLAQAKADAVFLGARLAPVADALATARLARRLMHQNLWIAVIYNAIAVPLAIAGLVTPLVAAAAMSGSSIIVTLNALRAGAGSRADGAGGGQG
jgi:Cu2+-exporting ATPase